MKDEGCGVGGGLRVFGGLRVQGWGLRVWGWGCRGAGKWDGVSDGGELRL